MKKICILISMMLMLVLTGCSDQPTTVDKLIEESSNVTESNISQSKVDEVEVKVGDGVLDIPQSKTEEPKVEESKVEEPKVEESKVEQSKNEKIDIDLSGFSTIVAYSEVYNMLSKPDDYLGKIVKVKGNFSMFHDTNADKYYFATIIADQTACCQIGLEFVLAGNYSYPNDYPEIGKEIEITGEFQTYMEGNMRYANLVNAKMEF